MTSLIAALTRQHVIGKDGKIPWHLPEDLKQFRERTSGHAVIMGRHTWESIPQQYRPLPQRNNIVISTSMRQTDGIDVCRTLDDALLIAHTYDQEPFIIGGAQVYLEALERKLVDTMYLTWVDGKYDGDAYFPGVVWTDWDEKERLALNGGELVTYWRIR